MANAFIPRHTHKHTRTHTHSSRCINTDLHTNMPAVNVDTHRSLPNTQAREHTNTYKHTHTHTHTQGCNNNHRLTDSHMHCMSVLHAVSVPMCMHRCTAFMETSGLKRLYMDKLIQANTPTPADVCKQANTNRHP